ncbi:hypothetical protein UK12_08410 [Saccharothrix sp. ST-888]|nr:hypothetical protein UK12_08410 [Saccharothrix sp. ST-888]
MAIALTLFAVSVIAAAVAAGAGFLWLLGNTDWMPDSTPRPEPSRAPLWWILAALVALVLLLGVGAAVRRYRIAAAVQFVLAAVLVMGGLGTYAYEHRHDGERKPQPLPANYRPCYSGSNTCN